MIIVKTKPCIVCKQPSIVEIANEAGFQQWQSGQLIQQALPELDADTRELLISGTHPTCFNKLFGKEDGE